MTGRSTTAFGGSGLIKLQHSLWRRAIGSQHFAGEIERAGDQDARRRVQVELAGEIERTFEIVAGDRRKADIACNFGEFCGGHSFVLMDWYGNDTALQS